MIKIMLLLLFILISLPASVSQPLLLPERPRLYNRIPKFYVYDSVRTFLNEQELNNCYDFRETQTMMLLKCWRRQKLLDVVIQVLPAEKKKKAIASTSITSSILNMLF